jgi:hypothetical protein
MKGNVIQYIAQPGRALNAERYGGREISNDILSYPAARVAEILSRLRIDV